ncbi:tripartite motif-containing protein 42 [Rhinatrema bivittatum]|uniref:tripartite motif-containing protein 42 n=1 Tax=Rhinatrema bivittatum TaxID=194408 RepID=UPI00112E4405|nr:tripartite motif-containing protein 42 [Rhinatrema bivittatum]
MFCECACCTGERREYRDEITCCRSFRDLDCLNCFPTHEAPIECTCYKCEYSPKPGCRNCECECIESPECLGCYCFRLVDPLCYCVKVKKPCCLCCRKNRLQRKISQSLSSKERFERIYPVLLEKDLDKAIVQQLICPLCKQLYGQNCMLPCEHCLCKRCVDSIKSQTINNAETYLIITCPVCNISHYFSQIDISLPENYLKAMILRKYCLNKGIPLPKAERDPNLVYCDHCVGHDKNEAVLRCTTCRRQYFCHRCLWKFHNRRMMAYHNITEYHQREERAKKCFYHPRKLITEYCFTDKTLVCEDCKSTLHQDHSTLPLSQACAQEAHALFSAIAKFKRVKYGLETDLMEMNLLRSNYKINKDNRKKEIINGFHNLHAILNEHEKNMLESVENMENEKQQRIKSFLNKSAQTAYSAEGLMQYAKEALKEENQVIFLQSANTLVKEINDEVTSIYQPDPLLRQDPIRNLRLNFEHISSSLQVLFPQTIKQNAQDNQIQCEQKYLYVSDSGHDICLPKIVPSCQIVPCVSTISCKALDVPVCHPDALKDDNNGRAKSLPPITLPKSNAYRFWQEYPPSADTVKDYSDHEYCPLDASSSQQTIARCPSIPGQVNIYQTVAYPTAAKVFWAPPQEEVDFYDAEFQEVFSDKTEEFPTGDLIGKMFGIKQQSMELHNLSPNGEYLFRVRAVNSAGKGDWSEVLKIITPPVSEAPRQNQRRSDNHFLNKIRNVFQS